MLTFNMLLREQAIDPKDVRLLRHQRTGPGLTPFSLWRDTPAEFERYQSIQLANRRAYFTSPIWAGFVVPPDGTTLFVGLYQIEGFDPAPSDLADPLCRDPATLGNRQLDVYRFQRVASFDPLCGRLRIDWGEGKRSWAQRADSKVGNKVIVELSRVFREPDFPGYARFLSNLGELPTLPASWAVALRAARGVYLLTCPRTKEQYVGSAYGSDGFWGRWQSYLSTGHGGNVELRRRDPSDYRISILEVVGSAATMDDVLATEVIWKAKLQSREMGLNRN
jgi:hypothetical protein